MKILHVSDGDSYHTIWVDGVIWLSSDNNIIINDVFRLFEEKSEEGEIRKVEYESFSLYGDNFTSDIPEHINNAEDLKVWHLEQFGEEIDLGW